MEQKLFSYRGPCSVQYGKNSSHLKNFTPTSLVALVTIIRYAHHHHHHHQHLINFLKKQMFFYSWESINSNGDSFVSGQMGLVHVHPEFWLNPSSPLHYFATFFLRRIIQICRVLHSSLGEKIRIGEVLPFPPPYAPVKCLSGC